MKSRRRIFAVIFIIFMIIASTGFAYGELYSVRSDKIEIEVPDNWSLEEIDSAQSAGAFEQILHSDNQNSVDIINLNLFFLAEESDEYIYFNDDKQMALDYYEKYGKTVIKQFYSESENQELVSIGEPEFYDGEWNGFLKVAVVVNNMDWGEEGEHEELIYLTAEEDTVHKLLVFSSHNADYGAADIMPEAEPIAESFYDYGYGAEMLGIDQEEYDDYDSDMGSDISDFIIGLIFILGPIIIVAVAVAKAAAKVKAGRQAGAGRQGKQGRGSSSGTERARNSYSFGERLSGGDRTAAGNGARELFREKTRKRPEARSDGMLGGAKAPRSEKPQEIFAEGSQKARELFAKRPGSSRERSKDYPAEHTATRPVAQDAGTKYVECLRTLYKSGLLTKEELRQMLEKYQSRR